MGKSKFLNLPQSQHFEIRALERAIVVGNPIFPGHT